MNYLIAFNLDNTGYKMATYKDMTKGRYEIICEFFREVGFNYLTNTTWAFSSDLTALEIKEDLYKKGVFLKNRDIIHIIEVNTDNWAYDRHHWQF